MTTFSTKQDYSEYVERNLDFSTPSGKRIAVVYSHDYINNRARAQQAVNRDPTLYTIEDTVGGKWLEAEKLYSNLSPKEAADVWAKASERFIAQATVADVETYVIGAQADGVYRSVEQSAVGQYETIQTVNGVDKDEIFSLASPNVTYHRICEAQLFDPDDIDPVLQKDQSQPKLIEDYEVWLRDLTPDIEKCSKQVDKLRLRRIHDTDTEPEFFRVENELHQLADIAKRHPRVLEYIEDEKTKDRISRRIDMRQNHRPSVQNRSGARLR